MHPKSARSYRFRETSPMSSLSAPEPPINLPGRLEASSSLHQPQHNLGGASCRVDRSSIGRLQDASLQAQKLAVSFPDLDGIAPALATEKESLSATTPLRQLASEESTRQKLQEQVPPPTQLRHMMLQLGDVIEILQKVVRKLAEFTLGEVPPTLGAELAEACAKHSNKNNNTDDDNNNNNTNNNNNQTNNNNNNNDNDNNKNSRESGLNSLDLDADNPESEPDLDKTSLVSFNPANGS